MRPRDSRDGLPVLYCHVVDRDSNGDLEQTSPLAAALRKDGEMAKNLMRISAQRLLPIYQARLELAECN